MRMLLLSLLITKEVVLGLVIDVLSLLVVAARDPVLVHLLIWLLSRLIRCVCHNDFNSFKVFGTCSNPLDELQVLAFHISVTLSHLIALKGQFEHFLAS